MKGAAFGNKQTSGVLDLSIVAKGLNDEDIAERLNLPDEKVQACIAGIVIS